MKFTFVNIVRLTILVTMVVSSTPYFASIVADKHGQHNFQASFEGKKLSVKLSHPDSDHQHGEHPHSEHHDSSTDTEEHHIINIFSDAKLSSLKVEVPTILITDLPRIFVTKILDLKSNILSTLEFEELSRPPEFLTYQRTTILNI